MHKLDSVYGVVMAGGSGQRFWPLSRLHRPKQCLSLLGKGTMLQQACNRLADFLPASRILVLTRKGIEKTVAGQVPQLPRKNVVAEPCGRDTAACIALAACMLFRKDPLAVMVIVPSDHVFGSTRGLLEGIKRAAKVASENEVLITFGVTPTAPATGYGYIQLGKAGKDGIHHAARYCEKPDASTAQRFLESGDYLWNSGIFVWKAGAILNEIRKHLPQHGRMVDALLEAKDTRRFALTLDSLFPKLPKISIDYGVLEKSKKIAVLRCSLDWDDLGSWTSLVRYLPSDRDGNTLLGNVVVMEGQGNLVRTDDDHFVGVVGTRDLVVVHTSDATLVCPKAKAQELKKLIAVLQKNPKTRRFI